MMTTLRREARVSHKEMATSIEHLEEQLSELEVRLDGLDERDQASANGLPLLPAAAISVPLGLVWWRRRSKR